MNRNDAGKMLSLISKAWGKRQQGYVFLPYIDREAQRRSGSRKAGFHEGPAFRWPQDRDSIVTYMIEHQDHDLYWSCSLFEYPMRREDVAMDEGALWADLDSVDPSTLDEYPPTIAWESSPGRYQALWVAASGDFQGASWPGNENQRMTYLIGADPSGWDTVQLLRVPGWHNHKPEYQREDGSYPEGRLLWSDGPTYQPGDFRDLPEAHGGADTKLTDALESEIDGVDRHEVIARVRLKLTKRARDMLTARETSGDRSDQLWYLIRCLADVGCSVAEIVAVVRETVWNKFRDRGDELRRLIIEASKAISQRSPETTEKLEAESAERDAPQRLGFLLANIRRPVYIIDQILTEGACGFIAGEPKCYKSWIALDMALSVSTGAPFLGHFRVSSPGPVLYLQEEDPPTTLKARSGKIWVGKATDRITLEPSETIPQVLWLPPDREAEFDPQVNAYIQKGLTISDEAWQIWLDETLEAGMDGTPYRVVLIDTLMMTAGNVEETRAQEMTTKIFRPLKVLSRKYNVAFQVVHHMGKADRPRAGQRMLGSTANHAWAEDSLYLARAGMNDIRVELESKTAPGHTFRMSNVNNTVWEPHIAPWRPDDEETSGYADAPEYAQHQRGRSRRSTPRANPKQTQLINMLREAGAAGMTTQAVAERLGISRSTASKRLQRLGDGIEAVPTPSGSTCWIAS